MRRILEYVLADLPSHQMDYLALDLMGVIRGLRILV